VQKALKLKLIVSKLQKIAQKNIKKCNTYIIVKNHFLLNNSLRRHPGAPRVQVGPVRGGSPAAVSVRRGGRGTGQVARPPRPSEHARRVHPGGAGHLCECPPQPRRTPNWAPTDGTTVGIFLKILRFFKLFDFLI
jgi:hypothetical protein